MKIRQKKPFVDNESKVSSNKKIIVLGSGPNMLKRQKAQHSIGKNTSISSIVTTHMLHKS